MRQTLLTIVALMVIISGCKKDEGEGGYATISGKLYGANAYHPELAVSSDDGLPKEDVFIVYGDESVAGDKVETNADGSFEFRYLTKGKYTIYAYSLDTSLADPDGKVMIAKTIEITERKQAAVVENFVVYKDADDDGTCTITGNIHGRNYNGSYTTLQGEGPAQDVDVYINYGTSTGYHDHVKTDANGNYRFTGLRKGTYHIYTFSDVPVVATAAVPDSSPTGSKDVFIDVSVSQNRIEVQAPQLTVNL
jgi:hypothetical protein